MPTLVRFLLIAATAIHLSAIRVAADPIVVVGGRPGSMPAIVMMLGLACGIPLGILAIRPLYAQLYGVDALDPLTLLAAIALLTGVTLLACWKPAHGASRVDRASLLRTE